MEQVTLKALDSRARRAAILGGYIAKRSSSRTGAIDNYGQFMLIDADTGIPISGFQFDMSAEEVLEFLKD